MCSLIVSAKSYLWLENQLSVSGRSVSVFRCNLNSVVTRYFISVHADHIVIPGKNVPNVLILEYLRLGLFKALL